MCVISDFPSLLFWGGGGAVVDYFGIALCGGATT